MSVESATPHGPTAIRAHRAPAKPVDPYMGRFAGFRHRPKSNAAPKRRSPEGGNRRCSSGCGEAPDTLPTEDVGVGVGSPLRSTRRPLAPQPGSRLSRTRKASTTPHCRHSALGQLSPTHYKGVTKPITLWPSPALIRPPNSGTPITRVDDVQPGRSIHYGVLVIGWTLAATCCIACCTCSQAPALPVV